MRIRQRSKLLAGAVLLSLGARSQRSADTRHAMALLNPVEKTGFYRIILPPQIVARCKPDLSDLRIMRPDGEEIPYVLNSDVHSPWNAGYQPLPDPMIRQKDSSDKHSYVWLEYKEAYRVDRLSFVIQGPRLYKRRVRIVNPDTTEDRRVVTVVSIDSYDSVFRIPPTKGRRLLIEIDNADNAPLAVTRVASYQSGIYVLAHLAIGYDYSLQDLLNAGKPDYDLHYFTDSLRRRPMDIGVQYVRLSEFVAPAAVIDSTSRDSAAPAPAATARTKAGSSTVLLWSVLALVLLFLLYFSVRMVKAIGKKENNDRV